MLDNGVDCCRPPGIENEDYTRIDGNCYELHDKQGSKVKRGILSP